jgi:ribosomal protein S18 acetylase RimI-like enzyme
VPGLKRAPPEVFHRYSLHLDVVVRTAHAEDLKRLEWFGMFTPHRSLIREAYERQEEGEVVMLVAEVNGFPAGQAWVDLVRREMISAGYIWAMRVIPILQRKGVGTRLLQAAEEAMRARGLTRSEIGVEKDNPGARRLYERAGYRVVHEEYDEYEFLTPQGVLRRVPVDQWILRKSLRPEGEGGVKR